MLGHGGAAKRVIDLLVATPLLLLMLPVLLGCALLVWVFSPGPMLYRQQRSGRDGRVFSLYKLRTMRPDSDRRIEALVREDPVARDEWARYRRLTATRGWCRTSVRPCAAPAWTRCLSCGT